MLLTAVCRATIATREAARAAGTAEAQLPPGDGSSEASAAAKSASDRSAGAGEVAFTISRETLVGGEFGEGMSLDDYIDAIGLPSGGAVRASLGLASNTADINRFAHFASDFVDLTDIPGDLPPRTRC